MAGYAVGSHYAVNPTVGRATVLPAHCVSAPLAMTACLRVSMWRKFQTADKNVCITPPS